MLQLIWSGCIGIARLTWANGWPFKNDGWTALAISRTPARYPKAVTCRYFGCGMMFTIIYPSFWIRK